ncbi:pyruvate ferredoxin oxidoreductase [bacterium]|nr:pyruvate ferredoxin oxidoreductase [bacterium]
MAINIKEISKQKDLLSGGHRACAGCTGAVIIRQVMHAAGPNTVIGFATGCMEVVTTIYPYTSWEVSYIHNAFENSASTVSGVETAYRALKKKGKIDEELNFIAFGGDGGTYDIGFQALSGAMERRHNMLYICYDNEAYMNTGIQRSGATPYGAHTSTSPAGKKIPGKQQHRKDLTAIMAAHDISFAAQAAPHNWRDLMTKVQKALAKKGPAFINVLMPCPVGWRFGDDEGIDISRHAVETCFWPLYEVEDGVWKINYTPKEKQPIESWLKRQGRFKHLFAEKNRHIIDEIQAHIDYKWEQLQKQCEISKA